MAVLAIAVLADTINLSATACDACVIADIDTSDANYDTLDKNEVWIVDYQNLNCDTFADGNVTVDIWSQDVPSGDTVTLDCSVDGSTWDKCGTNTWTPAGTKTRYSYALSGVTCANIDNLQMRLESNDAGGPDDFYLDYTFVYSNYTVAADTCTPPGSGDWNVDCSDACDWNSGPYSVPADMIMTGTGIVTLSALMDFTAGSGQEIYMSTGCELRISSGGEIRG